MHGRLEYEDEVFKQTLIKPLTGKKEVTYLGTRKFNEGKSLHKILLEELANDRMAWYVDYFTDDPETFEVRYIATEPNTGVEILMTNENKNQRDAADPENGQWGPKDVAEWFKQEVPNGDKIEHRWIMSFTSDTGEVWGLHIEAYRIFCFGPNVLSLPSENLWDSYVEDGIAGPLKASLEFKKSKLHAIVINPDVFGTLSKIGLVQDYMLALAQMLD